MSETNYEKNIKVLNKKNSNLCKAIEELKEAADSSNAIKYKKVNVGDREILCADKEDCLFQLESIYSNEKLLNKWYEKYETSFREQTFVMFGLGNGMFARKLLDSVSDDIKSNVIIVEPFLKGLRQLFELVDFSYLLARDDVYLYVWDFDKMTFEALIHSAVDYANLKGVKVFEYPNYSLLFTSEIKQFYYEIRTGLLRADTDRGAIEYFGGLFYLNTIRNLRNFIDSYSFDSLKEKIPEGTTAIIVSSGPSLSKNIKELHKAKGHALIVSVDSALRVLLKEGIIPDIYVSIDATKDKSNFDEEIVKEIPVIGELTLPVYAYKEGQKKFISFANNEYIIKYFYDKDKGTLLWDLREGGSVANASFLILRSLGIRKFILCGQDLAYTGNKAHADNVAFDDDAEMKAEAVFVKDIYGEEVKSNRLFLLYKTSFENAIRQNPDITVIDSTEGGAYIEGSTVMPLKESISKECQMSLNFKECVDKSRKLFNDEERKDIANYFTNIPTEIKKILKDAKKSADNYERMLTLVNRENRDNREIISLFKKNQKLSEKIDNNCAMAFVNYLIQSSVHNVMVGAFDVKDDVKDELTEACILGLSHAKSIVATSEWILRDMEEHNYFDNLI